MDIKFEGIVNLSHKDFRSAAGQVTQDAHWVARFSIKNNGNRPVSFAVDLLEGHPILDHPNFQYEGQGIKAGPIGTWLDPGHDLVVGGGESEEFWIDLPGMAAVDPEQLPRDAPIRLTIWDRDAQPHPSVPFVCSKKDQVGAVRCVSVGQDSK